MGWEQVVAGAEKFAGTRVAQKAMIGASIGATIGGIRGAVSDDSSFIGGAIKGGLIGGALGGGYGAFTKGGAGELAAKFGSGGSTASASADALADGLRVAEGQIGQGSAAMKGGAQHAFTNMKYEDFKNIPPVISGGGGGVRGSGLSDAASEMRQFKNNIQSKQTNANISFLRQQQADVKAFKQANPGKRFRERRNGGLGWASGTTLDANRPISSVYKGLERRAARA